MIQTGERQFHNNVSPGYWYKTVQLIQKEVSGPEGIETPSVMKMGETPFHILIFTIISLRTKDKVTEEASERLFNEADTVEKMGRLSAEEIGSLIYPCGFFRRKGESIEKICRIILEEFKGKVPNDKENLMRFPGVGLKTANLVLSLGFNIPAICVDIHVHRIANRMGWVHTANADKTEAALSELLPVEYHIPINHILVKFGQKTCKPLSPYCSRCPLADFCPAIGVTKKR